MQRTSGETYIEAANYAELVKALVAAASDPDRIKIALGELGDIWPATIEADAALS